MGIVDNLLLKEYYIPKGPFIKKGDIKKRALELVDKLEIKTPSINHSVKQLSGGNIQKVLLGREINLSPKVLITSYAVRGLDIGATYKIYELLNEEKKKGVSLLFVGEDIDVLLALCDRILVLCGGKVTGICDARSATKEQIGMMMGGKSLEQGGEDNSEN